MGFFASSASLIYAENANVLDFDASPTGKELTTAAIQKAIDHCSGTGGGTVTVPPGEYLIHTLYLKSNVNLHIEKGAVLLADTVAGLFDEGLLLADGIENTSITGLGTIDGQGYAKYFPMKGPRQISVYMRKCRNMRITDISLLNASEWSIRLKECDGVVIRGVRIYAYVNQNNDGIDIDAKNVIVSDCIVDCEDDAICLKSDHPGFLVENITITNCIVATNCNAFKFGTASYCGFKNISISNCVVRRPSEAGKIPPRSTLKGCHTDTIGEIGIALEIVDGGVMDQVAISNITMTGIQTPLFIRLGNRGGLARRLHANAETAEYGKLENPVSGKLRNVIISNICATVETMVSSSITGIPGSYVENVLIRDVIFNVEGAGTLVEAEREVPEKIAGYPQAHMLFGYSMPAYGLYARHVNGLVIDNFIFNLKTPDARPALMLDDCHNIRISNFDVDTPSEGQPLLRFVESSNIGVSGYRAKEHVETFLSVEGDVSSNIRLFNNDFSKVKKVADFAEGASKLSVSNHN